MVLVTHKLQGSHVAFPLRSPTWSKGLILKRHITTVHVVARKEKRITLRQNYCLSIEHPCHGVRAKPFRISSFKGGSQNNDAGGLESVKKVAKNSVKLSYLLNDDEETLNGSPKGQNTSLSYASEGDDTLTGQLAIQKLFKKWLTMLRTQLPSQGVDVVLGEEPSTPASASETCNETLKMERVESPTTVLSLFWSLDATIKIPVLLFVPGFVAVNTVYGAKVAKELMPLWVFGPLIVALYIKMLQSLCALYVFCFKQTFKIIKDLPAYYHVAYNYLAQGKLQEDARARIWQPVVDIKNTDFKEVFRVKLKEFQEWIIEKYLDYVESIWPYYCRTIRFLKRANLI